MILQVEELTKSFGGLLALNYVSFAIEKGAITGLIGPNGSGKSTAFNIITGTFPPSSDKIIFNGEDITPLPAHQVAVRGIGRTFQLVKPMSVPASPTDVAAELKGEGEMT